jgi:6-phosphofructo-2-kinase
VAILDGTNITRDRRKIISDRISSLKGYDILWVESASVRGEDVSEQQFEELKNSPDFLDKVLNNDYYTCVTDARR